MRISDWSSDVCSSDLMRSGNATLSNTDICGNSAKLWNTIPMRRLCGGKAETGSSSKWISPESGRRNPAIRLSSVVLPLPDGPRRVRKLPGGTSSEQLSTATTWPKRLPTPEKRPREEEERVGDEGAREERNWGRPCNN